MGTGNDMKPVTTPSARFTYEDFLNFPSDGKRHEVIDGEHCVTPSPNRKHQVDVVFSDLDVVQPDLLYISRERSGILTDEHVRGSPDLVVEIVSPGTRKTDEVTKRKLYERFDVQEYWVVDPDLDAVKVYRRDAGVFAPPRS